MREIDLLVFSLNLIGGLLTAYIAVRDISHVISALNVILEFRMSTKFIFGVIILSLSKCIFDLPMTQLNNV